MKVLTQFTKIVAPVTLLAIVATASSMAQSAVTLNVDKNIKVTAINGQAVNTSLLRDPKMTYTLQPGQHVITAKYDRLYELRRDDHDYLRSANITVTANMQDNQAYRLVMPNQPERYEDAKKFIKAPTLAIMSGSDVIASQTAQANNGGLLSGLNLGKLFGGSAVDSNTQAIAAMNQSGSSGGTSNIATATPAVHTISQGQSLNISGGSTLDNFMQMWLNATPDEREKIRSWVSK